MGSERHEAYAYRAVSQPWPGRNGPRDFRVLWSLLRQTSFSHGQPFTISCALRWLSISSGLGDGSRTITEALTELEKGGWLHFTPGSKREWKGDRWTGEQSTIELIPPEPVGFWPITRLDPRADLWSELGSAGFLIVSRMLFEPKDYSARELAELTGVPYRTVTQTMAKRATPVVKLGRRYVVAPNFDGASLPTTQYDARMAKYQKVAKRSDSHPTPQPTLSKLHSHADIQNMTSEEALASLRSRIVGHEQEAREAIAVEAPEEELEAGLAMLKSRITGHREDDPKISACVGGGVA